jgi:hypothetical protein
MIYRQLTAGELACLDDASLLTMAYPYRFLRELGTRHV